jgi:hypothetical protein
MGFIMLFNVWALSGAITNDHPRNSAGTPGERGHPGPAGISGVAGEFIPVGAHDLFMAASSHYTLLGGRPLLSRTSRLSEAYVSKTVLGRSPSRLTGAESRPRFRRAAVTANSVLTAQKISSLPSEPERWCHRGAHLSRNNAEQV